MKILPISDVHIEFHADQGESFFQSLPEADVLVLAGDIGVDQWVGWNIHQLARSGKYKNIFYIYGNHEYYRTFEKVRQSVKDAVEANPGRVHAGLQVQHEQFVGCTLWYPDDPILRTHARSMGDPQYINDWARVAFQGAESDRDFLSRNVSPGCIVFTHMLPSHKCVSARFRHSVLNGYFVHDQEQLIHEEQPSLWIHGHTHDAVDIMIGKTRVFANPFGYNRENPHWKPAILEV